MDKVSVTSVTQKKIIARVMAVLRAGGLIVFPSDTVYGLGVDPTNHQAVQKLFAIKSRALTKAISVVVADQKMAQNYVQLNQEARQFYHHFLPGPFTVVSKARLPTKLDPLIYSYKNTLGIRIPDFSFLTELSRQFGKSITATSANISGKSPHYSLNGFLRTLSDKRKSLIDLAIDMGKLPRHQPSTVVDLSKGKIKELRSGDISFGKKQLTVTSSPKQTKSLAKKLVKDNYRGYKCLIFALVGELGAGKTTFCQGIGQHFGINKVNSPTFIISKEYDLPQGKFYHIDTYRLEQEEELVDLGLNKMVKPGNIIAIEWAQKAKSIIQSKSGSKIIWVLIKARGKDSRELNIFV